MSVGSIIFLVFLMLFFIGGFIFFIVMEFWRSNKEKEKIKHKKKRK